MKTAINKNNKKGFTLIEVIIAIFIIIIGITGAVNLISHNISSIIVSRSQVIAVNLAQEGLEIVRAIRDTNWLEDADWNVGLDTCSAGCRIQYNSIGLLTLDSNPVLNIDSNGLYLYDITKPETLFRRKITITTISATEIKVVSEVTWSERGRSFVISAEERLYDWK